MLKIAIPVNMLEKTSEHFSKAGRKISFKNSGQQLGVIERTRDIVVLLRSYDIPVEVEDSCDVGLCGSDWVEEKRLELGVDLEVLSEFRYGRKTLQMPTLDLVAREDDPLSSIEDLEPGSLILTEYPHLTRKFLEEHGLRVAQLGAYSDVPKFPGEFRQWCQKEGFVGIRIIHGRAPGLVNIGAGYGVMVNERKKTLGANDLRVVENIMDIKTWLIADRDALISKESEISKLHQDLDRAYFAIGGETEAGFARSRDRRI